MIPEVYVAHGSEIGDRSFRVMVSRSEIGARSGVKRWLFESESRPRPFESESRRQPDVCSRANLVRRQVMQEVGCPTKVSNDRKSSPAVRERISSATGRLFESESRQTVSMGRGGSSGAHQIFPPETPTHQDV